MEPPSGSDFGVPSCTVASDRATLPAKHYGIDCGDKGQLPQLTWIGPSSLELPHTATYGDVMKKLLTLSENGGTFSRRRPIVFPGHDFPSDLLDVASLYSTAIPHQPDRIRTQG
ncbi:phosphatidylethanolamine-binding protein [Cystoisospora suis]|uniref:Phosphatidylethanolamine-binding protein n=1 Tax=Cystoisospora suis TaxID=483139 RepID=A0A2C6KQJ6_9APIC|nr:phosphatidylethanolamine-binding protein [Cystoisospora suis]